MLFGFCIYSFARTRRESKAFLRTALLLYGETNVKKNRHQQSWGVHFKTEAELWRASEPSLHQHIATGVKQPGACTAAATMLSMKLEHSIFSAPLKKKKSSSLWLWTENCFCWILIKILVYIRRLFSLPLSLWWKQIFFFFNTHPVQMEKRYASSSVAYTGAPERATEL